MAYCKKCGRQMENENSDTCKTCQYKESITALEDLYKAGLITDEDFRKKRQTLQTSRPESVEQEEETYYGTHKEDNAYKYLMTICTICTVIFAIIGAIFAFMGLFQLFQFFDGGSEAEGNEGLWKMMVGTVIIFLSFMPMQCLKFVKRHYSVMEHQNQELYELLRDHLQ